MIAVELVDVVPWAFWGAIAVAVRPAESLDEAYAWAETHPLPDIPRRRNEARLVVDGDPSQ